MDTFLLQCTTRNVNANSAAPARGRVNYWKSGSRPGSESGESALQIGDQIVAVFESDREPQKVGGDACLPLYFGRHAAVSHGRGRADQSRKSAQRRGQGDELQCSDEPVRRGLPAGQLEAQHES